jgi:hypothetical protein
MKQVGINNQMNPQMHPQINPQMSPQMNPQMNPQMIGRMNPGGMNPNVMNVGGINTGINPAMGMPIVQTQMGGPNVLNNQIMPGINQPNILPNQMSAAGAYTRLTILHSQIIKLNMKGSELK